MSTKILVTVRKSLFYPKSLAEQDPDFIWDEWDSDPLILNSGEVALISVKHRDFFYYINNQLTQFDEETKFNYYYSVIDQNKEKMYWTDDGYVMSLEFDNPQYIEIFNSVMALIPEEFENLKFV